MHVDSSGRISVTVQLGRNPCALRGTAVQRLGGGRWEKGRKRRGEGGGGGGGGRGGEEEGGGEREREEGKERGRVGWKDKVGHGAGAEIKSRPC